MLAVASVLRWMSGSSWGEAGLGGKSVFRDTLLGACAGTAAFLIVAVTAGTSAIGELAIVRGNGEALVLVGLLTVAFAAAGEMVFRGFIMTRVAAATDSWAMGNIVAAIAFGIAIGGDDIGAVIGLSVAGLGYGLLYLAASRRLALAIATHATFGLGAVLAAYLQL